MEAVARWGIGSGRLSHRLEQSDGSEDMTNAVATRRCSTRTGSSIRVNRDAKRVHRVRVFFGETENVSKFGAPCARRTVYGDSPPVETES